MPKVALRVPLQAAASSEAELAELRAIERAGLRRRRRWLNDKVLRDIAGPMTAQDMHDQFHPVPFGSAGPPSAFALAATAEVAPLWDKFRNIDADKQAAVLQRWEQHNQEQAVQRRRGHVSAAEPRRQHEMQAAAAVAALDKWRRIARGTRCGLASKRAAQARPHVCKAHMLPSLPACCSCGTCKLVVVRLGGRGSQRSTQESPDEQHKHARTHAHASGSVHTHPMQGRPEAS